MTEDLAKLKRQLNSIVNDTKYTPLNENSRRQNKSSDSIYVPHQRIVHDDGLRMRNGDSVYSNSLHQENQLHNNVKLA